METKTITIRIPSLMYEGMQKHLEAGSITQQVLKKLKKADSLTQMAVNELRGKFTPGEWMYMANTFETPVGDEFRYDPKYLAWGVESSYIKGSLDEKWKIDARALRDKCLTLTTAQTEALYSRIEEFWSNGASGNADTWSRF